MNKEEGEEYVTSKTNKGVLVHLKTDGEVHFGLGRNEDEKEFAYNGRDLKKGVVCFCSLESTIC